MAGQKSFYLFICLIFLFISTAFSAELDGDCAPDYNSLRSCSSNSDCSFNSSLGINEELCDEGLGRCVDCQCSQCSFYGAYTGWLCIECCGDGFCNPVSESSVNCPADCGLDLELVSGSVYIVSEQLAKVDAILFNNSTQGVKTDAILYRKLKDSASFAVEDPVKSGWIYTVETEEFFPGAEEKVISFQITSEVAKNNRFLIWVNSQQKIVETNYENNQIEVGEEVCGNGIDDDLDGCIDEECQIVSCEVERNPFTVGYQKSGNLKVTVKSKNSCDNYSIALENPNGNIPSFLSAPKSVDTCTGNCSSTSYSSGCIGAGESIQFYPGSKEKCCPGLKEIPIIYGSGGLCGPSVNGAMLCSDCGNNFCEGWENECNCAEDCSINVAPASELPSLLFSKEKALFSTCGNGYCEEGEDGREIPWDSRVYCPEDCENEETDGQYYGSDKFQVLVEEEPCNGGTVSVSAGSAPFTSRGEDCGRTSQVAPSTSHQIMAVPAAGYEFVRWEHGLPSNPHCYIYGSESENAIIKMKPYELYHNACTVKAIFSLSAPSTYSLSVNASPSAGGNVSGSGSVVEGERKQIVAIPKSGYSFAGWTLSGSCTILNASSSRTSVTVNGDCTATAKFSENTYSLSVSASPSAGGTVEGESSDVLLRSTMPISASPSPGYSFVEWTDFGGCLVSDKDSASTTVLVNGNCIVIANFEKKYKFTIYPHPSGTGTVSGTGFSGSGEAKVLNDAPENQWVQISASPSSGYKFLYWQPGYSEMGTVCSLENEYNSNFSTNRVKASGEPGSCTYRAVFEESCSENCSANGQCNINCASNPGCETDPDCSARYSLTVLKTPSAGGSVTGTVSSVSLGSTHNISASPDSSFLFVRWSLDGDCRLNSGATIASNSVTVNGDCTATAEFSRCGSIFLQTSPIRTGSVVFNNSNVSQISCPITVGQHKINISPDEGYSIVELTANSNTASGDGCVFYGGARAGDPDVCRYYKRIYLTDDGRIAWEHANYLQNSSLCGWNSPVKYSGSDFPKDSTVGYYVWIQKTKTEADCTFIAYLSKPEEYSLEVVASPSAGGSVSGSGTVVEGAQTAIVAVPSSNYSFTGWTTEGDCSVQNSSLTRTSVTVNGDCTATANFSEDISEVNLVLSASPSNRGTVEGAGEYAVNSRQYIEVSPVEGFALEQWTCYGDCSLVSANNIARNNIDLGETDCTCIAYLEEIEPSYNFSARPNPQAGGNASVSNPDPSEYERVIVSASSNSGYSFAGWSEQTGNYGCSVSQYASSDTTITITARSDCEFVANFVMQSLDDCSLDCSADNQCNRDCYNMPLCSPDPDCSEWCDFGQNEIVEAGQASDLETDEVYCSGLGCEMYLEDGSKGIEIEPEQLSGSNTRYHVYHVNAFTGERTEIQNFVSRSYGLSCFPSGDYAYCGYIYNIRTGEVMDRSLPSNSGSANDISGSKLLLGPIFSYNAGFSVYDIESMESINLDDLFGSQIDEYIDGRFGFGASYMFVLRAWTSISGKYVVGYGDHGVILVKGDNLPESEDTAFFAGYAGNASFFILVGNLETGEVRLVETNPLQVFLMSRDEFPVRFDGETVFFRASDTANFNSRYDKFYTLDIFNCSDDPDPDPDPDKSPGTPKNLTTSAGSIVVSWEAPTEYTDGSLLNIEDINNFDVFRSIKAGGPYTQIGITSGASETSFVDSSAKSNQTYCYVVTAIDVLGKESAYSEEVCTAICEEEECDKTFFVSANNVRAIDNQTEWNDLKIKIQGDNGVVAECSFDFLIGDGPVCIQEICGNGLDDDCDGLIDWADSDCENCGNGEDDEGETCFNCPQDMPFGECEELCGDGVDNDGDGFIDEECEICFNLVDDDGDGLIDEGCGEPDCSNGLDDDGDGEIDNCPDLVVENVYLHSTGVRQNSFNLGFTISNKGRAIATIFKNSVFRGNPAFGDELQSEVLSLGIGESKTITLPITLFSLKNDFNVVVFADSTESISELDEENNKKIFIVNVGQGPDLTVDRFTSEEECVNETETYTLFAIVRNIGTKGILESFYTSLYKDSIQSTPIAERLTNMGGLETQTPGGGGFANPDLGDGQ